MRRITLAALLMGLAACPAHACETWQPYCTPTYADQQERIDQLTRENQQATMDRHDDEMRHMLGILGPNDDPHPR